MSKVSGDHMRKCIGEVLKGAEDKKRGFLETIELQVGLKNYDPQKDKRFAGNIKLPHIPRPKMRICVLGDAYHCEKAAGLGLDFKNAEGLKNFNKNKKLIKKFGARAPRPLAARGQVAGPPREGMGSPDGHKVARRALHPRGAQPRSTTVSSPPSR